MTSQKLKHSGAPNDLLNVKVNLNCLSEILYIVTSVIEGATTLLEVLYLRFNRESTCSETKEIIHYPLVIPIAKLGPAIHALTRFSGESAPAKVKPPLSLMPVICLPSQWTRFTVLLPLLLPINWEHVEPYFHRPTDYPQANPLSSLLIPRAKALYTC